MSRKSGFIFHDPSGLRWTRFARALQTGAVVAILLGVIVGLAALTAPQLPKIGLPPVQRVVDFKEVKSIIRGEKTAQNTPFRLRKDAAKLKYVRSVSPVLHPVKAPVVSSSHPVVFGYYVNWDRASARSLRANVRNLTHLVPEWLVLRDSKGNLADESDNTIIDIAAQGQLPILAMVTNYRDGWQAGDVHRLLNSPEARANLVDEIHSNLIEHKFAGVNLDLEQVAEKDRAKLVELVRQLRDRLKPGGFILTQSVPTDDAAYDLKKLAELNDYIVPMVYDEHYQSGEPGPVASQDWFEKQLARLAEVIPAEKTVIGMGTYGYDWIIGSSGSAEVAYNDVMAAAVAARAKIEWDPDQENPVLRYKAADGSHEVWFLDGVTGLNQVREIADYGFRGVGLWRLGAEDPGVWQVLRGATYPDEKIDVTPLKTLEVQQSVNQYGSGEIIRITEKPREGKRNVWRTEESDFAEVYETLPTYYVVESVGKPSGKVLVLTFDDGPDPEYTPAILDILKQKKVLAAFFLVGVNAEKNPDLVRRIYAEGHELGNHTYSHPNIAATSPERTRLELSSTERIIEHAAGVSTILFRPPYNADSEPEMPAEIEPVLRAQEMGFVTVGERIDPQDWRKEATADSIFDEVVAEVDNGSMILLHDAGGDRTATVAALPRIIDHLQAAGYRFATVSELIGKTRAEVMPAPGADEKRWAAIEGHAFDLKSAVESFVGLMFLAAIWLTVARSVLFGTMAMIEKRVAKRRQFDPDFRPPVSVIIAAYNEEAVIGRTIESVLSNGYPELEIVIVNDGSKDRTLDVLQQQFGEDARVRILSQSNGGKSSALNHAIGHARHDILVAVDADTIFGPDTIRNLVRHFSDGRVAAVSGNAKVGNRQRWLTRFQSIEYVYGFNLDRRALDLVNAIPVVPGAVGAWRKSVIEQLGGFAHHTLAEDTDLTLAIRRLGRHIRYEETAVAWTEAPEDVRGLAKQRFRWAFGTLQAAWKHRGATFNPAYGTLGFIALPSIWVFQVLLAGLSPLADIAMIATLFAGHAEVVLGYYLAFFAVELLTGFLAYYLEGESPRDLILLFPQRVFYRQLMHYVLLKSVLYAVRGQLVEWGKLERRATVAEV
jgi:cellulose synthase/poly-beta-1,6-N-acetylglucosamine synthase-like glycosyltransferase/spore germination protein YaaH/peptidoglycan/xylan/chitin deacetylase (PgdA/CDA1 family)